MKNDSYWDQINEKYVSDVYEDLMEHLKGLLNEELNKLKPEQGELNFMGQELKEKTLHNSPKSPDRENVEDLVTYGPDLFKLLSKASSEAEGWMKSTKAMGVEHGCVVQVTTQQKNHDGSYSLAEALTFVPGVTVVRNHDKSYSLVSK